VPVYSEDGTFLYNLAVTAIPAGHCPGSAMFLIRRDPEAVTGTLSDKFGRTTPLTVLYTGDFRFRIGATLKLRSLFDENKQLLRRINAVYVDTTFWLPQVRKL
jgi:Cft2 family RNA processing exonuclease